jgi:hypothetical protein
MGEPAGVWTIKCPRVGVATGDCDALRLASTIGGMGSFTSSTGRFIGDVNSEFVSAILSVDSPDDGFFSFLLRI